MTFHLRVLQGGDSPPAPDETVSREQARSRRKRVVRGKVISVKRITKRELEIGRLLYPVEDHGKPRTRSECADVPRPCPFVSCRWNLYLDMSEHSAARVPAIKLNFPDIEPDEMPEDGSCALDVADRGGASLEEVGAIMNLTRERVRQIEVPALEKVARRAPMLMDFADEGNLDRKGTRV